MRIVADTNTVLSGLLWSGISEASRRLSNRPPLPAPVSRDPDDDQVIACAIAAHARVIVSGDHDLLDLGAFGDIRFLTASSALALLDR